MRNEEMGKKFKKGKRDFVEKKMTLASLNL